MIKIFPANFHLYMISWLINTPSGVRVRNTRIALKDEPGNMAVGQLMALLGWMKANSSAREVSWKEFKGRKFFDASSAPVMEPDRYRSGLIGAFDPYDDRLRQFVNLPWLNEAIDDDALAALPGLLNLRLATYTPIQGLIEDIVTDTTHIKVAQAKLRDSRQLHGPEIGDTENDGAADSFTP